MTDRIQVYVPGSAEELREYGLRIFRLEAQRQPGLDPALVDQATRPKGDQWITFTGFANMAWILFANIRINDNDANLLTAEEDALDEIRQAEGLPVVPATPSTGSLQVIFAAGATANITNGQEFQLPNGNRGRVVGSHIGVPNTDPPAEVPVQTIDTGFGTRLDGGETVQWIPTPPTNLSKDAIVSVNDPLTGGTDEENDERKRLRILNKRQNAPAGGNWADKVAKALDSLGAVQMAFVYPALGGPGSEKVALVREIDPDNNSVSRELSVTAQNTVRAALQAAFPGQNERVVQSVADEPFDASVEVALPAASTSGGSGQGWLDDTVWPPHNTTPDAPVTITDVVSTSQIEVDADTVIEPIDGQTHVSWWSSVDQKFHTRLVIGHSGSAGAWLLSLDAGIVDRFGAPPQIGEYISPAAVQLERYGQQWIRSVGTLGPGENTDDANRLPRAARHPTPDQDLVVEIVGPAGNVTKRIAIPRWPTELTITQLDAIKKGTSITDIEWLTRSLTAPTVPASVADPPNVLVGRHFGIYER
jgi:uncharacterized phage protein gp47/JayE